jgi:4-hydroxybenzoate polyprenyltransferase
MLSNRLLDRDVDARNPRTVRRALPSGRSSSAAATSALAISIAGFMLVCAGFGVFFRNWWPISLGLPVLGWISLYPLAKRFTALCHLWLGSSLALSPLAAAIAVDPGSLAQPSLWLVALMVLGWVGGFDIIYALQDVEIDRAQRLHSMPANLGESGAMWISRGLHLFAAASLFAVLKVDDRFGSLFLAGAGLVAMLLAIEHLTVSRWGTSRMALSFFTLNGVISCVVGALGVSDLLKL